MLYYTTLLSNLDSTHRQTNTVKKKQTGALDFSRDISNLKYIASIYCLRPGGVICIGKEYNVVIEYVFFLFSLKKSISWVYCLCVIKTSKKIMITVNHKTLKLSHVSIVKMPLTDPARRPFCGRPIWLSNVCRCTFIASWSFVRRFILFTSEIIVCFVSIQM